MRLISTRTALFLALAVGTLLLSFHWLITLGMILIAVMSVLFEHLTNIPVPVIYAGVLGGVGLAVVGFGVQLGWL